MRISLILSGMFVLLGSSGGFAHPGIHEGKTPILFAPTLFGAYSLGSGDFSFQSVPGWCQLPESRPLGNTHGGIVRDEKGNIYFNTDTTKSILVYSEDGKFVRSFADKYPAVHGMLLRKEKGEEYIYAAHLAGKQVVKFRLDGTVVWTLGLPKESGKYEDNPGAYNPTAVTVGPNDHLYIADGYGRNWIHEYTQERKYVRSFGGTGDDPGKFRTCHGMAVDERGEKPCLLVCDRENRRLQRFDFSGNLIDVPITGLRRPCAVSFFGDHVAVAELEGRVAILDKEFKIVTLLGDNENRAHWANNGVKPEDWIDGIFTAPHSCCFDDKGNLYVMDWNASGRISKLKKK